MTNPKAYIAKMTSAEALTADDLAQLKVLDKRTELVGGKLVVREPAGFQHGVIAARVTRRMEEYVATHGLGVVVAAETGFKLSTNPDTVRAPDAGFIATARIPDPLPRGYLPLAPDLAVEVLSPDDRPGEVLSKVADWLNAGSKLVWVIDPQQRIARVYRENGTEALVKDAGELDGENVVAGFVLPLRNIF